MTRVALRNVIGPRHDANRVIRELAAALDTSLAVADIDGRLLHGDATDASASRHPIVIDGIDVGWVAGPDRTRVVATVIEHLLERERERKALGSEVLHLYREVNLMYGFSEKLAALLDLDLVGQLTIREARHLIDATDGVLMLLDDATGALATIAGFGDSLPRVTGFARGIGIVGSVAASGVAEIVNDVENDPRRVTDATGICTLLCAPLKVGEKVIGVIALGNTSPATYTAAELKLLSTLTLQTATAIENARLFERTVQAAQERERLLAAQQQMEVARAKLEREFELAARIQAELFPSSMPVVGDYDFAARNRPARQCGGDYYDALMVPQPTGQPRVLLCVADVSGKGMPAALLMSHTQATLRALVGRSASLASMASHASDLLFASTAPNKYVTAAFLEVDPGTGVARYVSAGHVDCLVLKADGQITRLGSTGAPLGLLPPGLSYEETSVAIAPGDLVLLYSDGVVDAQNAAGEEFGDERLIEVMTRLPDQSPVTIVDGIFSALDGFVGAAQQFDDITLLLMRRRSAGASA
ncbi:MAG TPA: GAF domain-containing SpoIIE family protein phosphatase [Vicinamibacterales bacterium]|jgi:sigma-B regulation protein RsbU (phosphoserine phosphatase)|nr:GAF domain-containing SpoIIE family protein phosphatase [Vicinamibacterales bacterium]